MHPMLSPDALAEKPDPVQQFDQNSQKILIPCRTECRSIGLINHFHEQLTMNLFKKKHCDMAKFYTNSLGSSCYA